MAARPYYRLPEPRKVDRPDLPAELVEFYSRHEGGVWEFDPHHEIRLFKLDEVERHRWRDVHLFGERDDLPGSEMFDAVIVGSDGHFDQIYVVLSCSWCAPGSVITIGVNVVGPGGSGPVEELGEPTLVLAPSFPEWLQRLERAGWIDYGIVPGSIDGLPPDERLEVRRYYKKLNPHITWGSD